MSDEIKTKEEVARHICRLLPGKSQEMLVGMIGEIIEDQRVQYKNIGFDEGYKSALILAKKAIEELDK